MKTALAIIGLALISASGAAAQDHAPLLAQCKADVRLWVSTQQEDAKKLTFWDLNRRHREMMDCSDVDMDSETHPYYEILDHFYALVEEIRYAHFIWRHDLNHQFLAEDKAGAR